MKLNKNVKWIPSFLEKKKEDISIIRNADGCRELWVQGEIYLYLNDDEVRTNATQKKYDVYKKDNFVIEIKFLGGNYQRKVLPSLFYDFEKLSKHDGQEAKFVLLILSNAETGTKLYHELFNFKHSKARRCFYRDYTDFCAILWKVS